MSRSWETRQYIDDFYDNVLMNAVESHSQITEVINIATNFKSRELWCVFVHNSPIEENDYEMWEDFWDIFCKRREVFYSDFKKPGLGYVTVYPLFISQERLQKILRAHG